MIGQLIDHDGFVGVIGLVSLFNHLPATLPPQTQTTNALHRTHRFSLVSRIQMVSGTGYPIWQVRAHTQGSPKMSSTLIYSKIDRPLP